MPLPQYQRAPPELTASGGARFSSKLLARTPPATSRANLVRSHLQGLQHFILVQNLERGWLISWFLNGLIHGSSFSNRKVSHGGYLLFFLKISGQYGPPERESYITGWMMPSVDISSMMACTSLSASVSLIS